MLACDCSELYTKSCNKGKSGIWFSGENSKMEEQLVKTSPGRRIKQHGVLQPLTVGPQADYYPMLKLAQ